MNLSPYPCVSALRRSRRSCAGRRFAALVLLVLGMGLAQAASPPVPSGDGAAVPPTPPKIGLVLSGGGARGFAHIGVLKVLQELRVPVDVVAGTSMGAIVGGLYAAGYSPDQIAALADSTDWAGIFSSRAPRADLTWRLKEDDFKNLSNFELGLRSDGPTLPKGLVRAQRLELFLRSLGGPVKEIRQLTDLPVPFAAVATDLETGRAVVLKDDVSLSTAMRASMSVPGAFAPVDYQGRLLVDGGLVSNLPVDVARQLGADIVIAVDVGRPLLRRSEITGVASVAEQITVIMGRDSVERAIASLTPRDLLITPALGEFGSSDFTDGAAIIAVGLAAARQHVRALDQYALSPEAFAAREVARTRVLREDREVTIASVRVEGLNRVNPQSVEADVNVPLGAPVTTADIDRSMQRVYGSGDFEAVQYSIVGPAGRRELVVTPIEKAWGYSTLRVGGNVQTDFGSESAFNFLVAHTWRWLNSWGGEWRNEIQIGDVGRLSTQFYQPLGPASRWFLMPRLLSERDEFDVYADRQRIQRVKGTVLGGEVQAGYEIGRLGTVRAGIGRARVATEVLISLNPVPPTSNTVDTLSAGLRLDTLDRVNFPTRGAFVDVGYLRFRGLQGSPRRPEQYSLQADRAFTFDRYTALLSAGGVGASLEGSASLGGLFQLSGTPIRSITGSRTVLLRGLFYRNVSDAFGDIQMPINAGFSLETGGAFASGESFDWSRLRRAMALFFGADSPVGPVYFAIGRTFGGDTGVYLYWGRPQ